MREITAGELSKILEEHKNWISTYKEEGKHADLSGAELSDANIIKSWPTRFREIVNCLRFRNILCLILLSFELTRRRRCLTQKDLY
jgi:hypothetical protein